LEGKKAQNNQFDKGPPQFLDLPSGKPSPQGDHFEEESVEIKELEKKREFFILSSSIEEHIYIFNPTDSFLI